MDRLKQQIDTWLDKHLAGTFIALGFTKATEVVIRTLIGPAWAVLVSWLLLAGVMFVIAARSPDVDV